MLGTDNRNDTGHTFFMGGVETLMGLRLPGYVGSVRLSLTRNHYSETLQVQRDKVLLHCTSIILSY